MSENLEIYDDMIGKVYSKVFTDENGERLVFEGSENKVNFYHSQDCCEHVRIEEIIGDLDDLTGSPIIQAEEVSAEGAGPPDHVYVDSYTWTFYKFATNRGSVTVRWLGESNGYYSESVDRYVEKPE